MTRPPNIRRGPTPKSVARRFPAAICQVGDLAKAEGIYASSTSKKIMEFFAEDCVLEMPRGPYPWGQRYVGKWEGLTTRFAGYPMSTMETTAIGYAAIWGV